MVGETKAKRAAFFKTSLPTIAVIKNAEWGARSSCEGRASCGE